MPGSMSRSRWTRSSASSRSGPGRGALAGLDVYLFPAVVGGGLGDIEEVLAAGRHLARAGARLFLYRPVSRALPPGVHGPWAWPPHRPRRSLRNRQRRALTVSPCWGVSAAPSRDEPFGRGGAWSEEAGAIESAYGADNTVHISLEEFARTYPARRENAERYREGGVPRATADSRLRGASGRRDTEVWRTAFRRFRAFDRPNVLHLFATFAPSPRFRREFPEAVQVGPLWSGSPGGRPRPRSSRRASVVWYASPASSVRIGQAVLRGLENVEQGVTLIVRSARHLALGGSPNVTVREAPPLPPRRWQRTWERADLRIATGSRTLLEAIEVGGPFLYFNGVVGSGRRLRRHRPEKIAALLRLFRRLRVSPTIVRDLDAFSRGQRVAEIAARAMTDDAWRRGFPRAGAIRRATPRDAGTVLVEFARKFAASSAPGPALVAFYRSTER
ncbi:MAG: hypothetical protein L3K17_01355 [Thermoplasmata archaeon]|nr:hypothetical protein [Thermoplasmata archaeon]